MLHQANSIVPSTFSLPSPLSFWLLYINNILSSWLVSCWQWSLFEFWWFGWCAAAPPWSYLWLSFWGIAVLACGSTSTGCFPHPVHNVLPIITVLVVILQPANLCTGCTIFSTNLFYSTWQYVDELFKYNSYCLHGTFPADSYTVLPPVCVSPIVYMEHSLLYTPKPLLCLLDMVHSLLQATVPPVSSTAFPVIDSHFFFLVLLSIRRRLTIIAPALFHIVVPWICAASWWLCAACIESARYLEYKLYLVTCKQFSLNWVNHTNVSILVCSVLRISVRSNIFWDSHAPACSIASNASHPASKLQHNFNEQWKNSAWSHPWGRHCW